MRAKVDGTGDRERQTHDLHHLLDIAAEPPKHDSDNRLDRNDPAFSPPQFRGKDRVDDGRPQQFERVRVRAEGKDSDLRVGEFRSQEERDRTEREADGDALQEVEGDEEGEGALVARREGAAQAARGGR